MAIFRFYPSMLSFPVRQGGSNALACCLVAIILTTGCGQNRHESYTPAEDYAREALVASLETWKAGKPADNLEPLPEGGPKLQAVDSDWRSGKKLASYEIVGELPKQEAATRPFSVKLQFEGAIAPLEVVYHVVGKDPLWIFRDKDYGQPQGM